MRIDFSARALTIRFASTDRFALEGIDIPRAVAISRSSCIGRSRRLFRSSTRDTCDELLESLLGELATVPTRYSLRQIILSMSILISQWIDTRRLYVFAGS